MRVPKVPKECAAIMAEIYGKEFGGKDSGAYRIGRDALKNITGRPIGAATRTSGKSDAMAGDLPQPRGTTFDGRLSGIRNPLSSGPAQQG